jgi:hypothetical protein
VSGERFRIKCHLGFDGCAGIIDIRDLDHGQKVTGYAINRGGGGSNYTAHKTNTGEWACRWCLDRLGNPRPDDQPLF